MKGERIALLMVWVNLGAMESKNALKVREIIRLLEEWAPPVFQESYDNSGLIVGDRNAVIDKVLVSLDCTEEIVAEAKNIGAPVSLLQQVAKIGKLPVPNFAAGGIATPADASLMMQLGAETVFVGSGIFNACLCVHLYIVFGTTSAVLRSKSAVSFCRWNRLPHVARGPPHL